MASKARFEKMKRTPKYSSRRESRCEISGRSRGVYRKFRVSRIVLRELALKGMVPGMRKASW